MEAFRYPVAFFSHGTPMLAYGEDRYQEMLHQFAAQFPKPRAVIILSAHSVSSDRIHILRTKENRIQHDFNGFPTELYEIEYRCPGEPEVADEAGQLLKAAGMAVSFDDNAPLDHGIWIPMLHLFPKGDVPVVRVSLPLNLTPAQILKMGHALAKLREEGVLMIASGGAVHNIRELKWSEKTGSGAPWANEFEEWLVQMLFQKNVDALITADEQPQFSAAHPSLEHYLPILFAIGASLPADEPTVLYRGVEYGSLSMLCFSLNHAQKKSLH